MLNLYGYVNAGYTVFAVYMANNDHGIVIAKSKNEYAVWHFNIIDGETPSFFWGHYTDNLARAIDIFTTKAKTMSYGG